MKLVIIDRYFFLFQDTFNRIFLLAVILLFANSTLYSQKLKVFNENKKKDLTEHYLSSATVKDRIISQKFGELAKEEGFLISDVIRNGSLFTKNLSRSGEINFSSEATTYLNELKDYLLKDYPEVQDDINVYITYNPVLNAFATVNKNIYINIGVLARVENEAELAYILGHEIMHVINYHIINQKRSINEQVQTLNKSDIAIKSDFIELYRHEMSLAHEFEADFDGLNLFLLTDYDQQDAVEALKLLKRSNESILKYPSRSDLVYFSDSVYQNYRDSVRSKDLSSSEKDKKDKTKLSTHPDIDVRIDTIIVSIKDFGNKEKSKSHYVVSEEKFNRIKDASIYMCSDVYKKNFDFVTTFNNASFELSEDGSIDKEKFHNDLGYALFGLVVDKINGMKLRLGKDITEVDSVLSYFYNTESLYSLTKWSFEVLDAVSNVDNKNVSDRYKINIANAVSNHTKNDSLLNLVGPFSNKVTDVEAFRLEDIEFEISPYVDISPGDRKVFNVHKRFADNDVSGKVAFFNLTNYHIKAFAGYGQTNKHKSEKTDIRSVNSIMNIEKDRPDDLKCIIPNEVRFKGEDYTNYSILNNWLNERLYFEGFEYISMYEKDLAELTNETDIEYAMTSLQIELKSFSFYRFLGYYLGTFLVPHYIPQIATNIAIGSLRNYKLTLIFRIDDGALAVWDKRTSIEPQTSAQIYSTYNEVLNYLKEK